MDRRRSTLVIALALVLAAGVLTACRNRYGVDGRIVDVEVRTGRVDMVAEFIEPLGRDRADLGIVFTFDGARSLVDTTLITARTDLDLDCTPARHWEFDVAYTLAQVGRHEVCFGVVAAGVA